MDNRIDQLTPIERWDLSRTAGFDDLSKFIAKEALKPADTTPHNLSLKEGIFWSYFTADFTQVVDYTPPSLPKRVLQIVGALLSFPFAIIYHLFLVTMNIRNRSLSWAGWGQQLAFCLTRDVMELFCAPLLLLSYSHQYATLCRSHHQAQKFCLLNMYQKGQKNKVLHTFLWHLRDDQHEILQSYLDKTSYENFAEIYPGKIDRALINNYLIKWSEDTTWLKDHPSNLERKLESVKTMLLNFKYDEHENLLNNTLTQLEDMEGDDELRYKYACHFASQFNKSENRFTWSEKLSQKEIEENNPTMLAGKEQVDQIIRGHTHFFKLYENSKDKPIECKEQFGKIIGETDEKDKNALIEFGLHLMELYGLEEKDLLKFKIASEILIRYNINKFNASLKYNFFKYLFSEEAIQLSFDIEEKIKNKQNIEELKRSPHYFDDLLKLYQELHPYSLKMIPKDRSTCLEFEKNLIPDLMHRAIRFEGYGTIDTESPKIRAHRRCFQLLEDINLDHSIFEATIERETWFDRKGIDKSVRHPLKNYLPQKENDVKDLVAINPKFLRYCHRDVFKNQKLLYDIFVLDVTALFHAKIPLNSIVEVQKHLRTLKTLLLYKKFTTLPQRNLPKVLMIKIFSHLITDSYAEANSLANNLMIIADSKKNLK